MLKTKFWESAMGGVIIVSLLVAPLHAEVPSTMTYQGRLTDPEGNALSGTFNMRFGVYADSISETPLWEEVHNNTTEQIVVSEFGLFEVLLGKFVALASSIFSGDGSTPYLQIEVNGEVLIPRKPLNSVPYAFTSSSGGGGDCSDCDPIFVNEGQVNSITSPMVLDGSIQVEDIGFDHGDLGGLGDDDHPHYAFDTDIPTSVDGLGGGTILDDVTVEGVLRTNQDLFVHSDMNALSESFFSSDVTVRGTIFVRTSEYRERVAISPEGPDSHIRVRDDSETERFVVDANSSITADVSSQSGTALRASTSGNGQFAVEVSGLAPNNHGIEVDVESATGIHVQNNAASASPLDVCNETSSATGNLIRAFSGPNCGDLRFRVDTSGDVTADGTFTGGGADFAELIEVEGHVGDYDPGDVLEISQISGKAVRSGSAYSSRVLGVVATQPGFLGVEDRVDGQAVAVGIVGILPCKVSSRNGAIRPGDLLTTSSVQGHAMRANPEEIPPGAILGKALEHLNGDSGVIRVVLSAAR